MSGQTGSAVDLRPLAAVGVIAVVTMLQALPTYAARALLIPRFQSIGMSDTEAFSWYGAGYIWGALGLLVALIAGAAGGAWTCLVVGLSLQALGIGLLGVADGAMAAGASWLLASVGHQVAVIGTVAVVVDRVRDQSGGALLASLALVGATASVASWIGSTLVSGATWSPALAFLAGGPVLALATLLSIGGAVLLWTMDRRTPRITEARTFAMRPLLLGLGGAVLASVANLVVWMRMSAAWAASPTEVLSAHVSLEPLFRLGGTMVGLVLVGALGAAAWYAGSRVLPRLAGAGGLLLLGLAVLPGSVDGAVPGLGAVLHGLEELAWVPLAAGVPLLWGRHLHWRLVVPLAAMAQGYMFLSPVLRSLVPEDASLAMGLYVALSVALVLCVGAWVAVAFLWPRLLGPTSGSADPRPSSPARPSSSP